MSDPTLSGAALVYGRLNDALKGTPTEPIPDGELYKLVREEELAAFRGLCRVLAMHHGKEMPKGPRRMVEDFAEMLSLSKERVELELEVALGDFIVQGTFQSGVLRRRGDFFDGVEDVPLRRVGEGRAVDDGRPPEARWNPREGTAKRERPETPPANPANDAPTMNTGGGAGSPRVSAARRKQIAMSVNKIGKEVRQAANTLLYTKDPEAREKYIEILLNRKNALLQLKEEIEAV